MLRNLRFFCDFKFIKNEYAMLIIHLILSFTLKKIII